LLLQVWEQALEAMHRNKERANKSAKKLHATKTLFLWAEIAGCWKQLSSELKIQTA
jgi:hypothetical protein